MKWYDNIQQNHKFPLTFLASANTGVEIISRVVQLAEQEPFSKAPQQ